MPTSPPTPPKPARHRGRWVLAGLALLLAALGLAVWLGLDPWLRGTLENQVSAKTHGQYRLTIRELRTRLWAGALHLRGVELQPTSPTLADTLPRLHLRLARLDLSGVGLLAWLRHQPVPIDSLTLDSLHLAVAALPARPASAPARPLHQQLPLRLGYLAVRHASGSLGPAAQPLAQLPAATITARDLLATAAGAADTVRLAYAASWQVELRHPQGRVGGHRLAVGRAFFASGQQLLRLDSVGIVPPGPGQGRPGAVQVRLAMAALQLRGWQAAAWQHQHRLRADSLVAQAPHLTFRPPSKPPPPLWKLLAPLAARADLGRLAVRDGSVAVVGLRHRPAAWHVFVAGRALRIDSLAGRPGRGRVLYAQAWAARSGRLTAVFDAPTYPASIEHLFLDTQAQTLRLQGLALRPAFTPVQLNRRNGYQVSQLRIRLPELRARGFDFGLLSDRSQLRVAHLTAESPWVDLASDGRGPINPHRSNITPEAVRRIALRFDVQQLDLRNGTLVSHYRSPRTPVLGRLTINRFNGTLRNVSNDPRRQSMARPLTGMATAYLQGRCRLEAHLRAPLLDPRGRHRLWGSFGPAPFGILNEMTVPTRLLGFEGGQVQRISFALQADQRQVTGTMRAAYTGLKFGFYRYKKGELRKPLLARIEGTLVNGVVIRDDNPRRGGRFVVGDMTSPREPRFSVFSLWRQGLVSGLLNSAGVPGKLAQKLSASQDSAPLP